MNIMYLNNQSHLGGDTKCILKLCKELKNDNKIIMVSMGGVLEKEFNIIGIKHYYINDVVNKMPHVIISNIYKLMKIVKDESIDIIHSHHRMATLTAKIVSRITGVKVIHTQHLCIEDKFKLTKLALNNIETITVSNAAKNILEKKSKLNGNKITTIYNTIETSNDNKIIDSKLIELKEKGYFIVAQISRVIDYKGVYDFVDIAKQTIEQNNNIRFVFIGDGPEKNNLQDYIIKNKLQEYVFMLGSKDNVIENLKYIDLVLLCSYIEGLPLAPLEAFSQKIPVIGTDIDGTKEEIIDGFNGFLVRQKDIERFKDNIIKLYNNKKLYEELSNNAYKFFNDKFNNKLYINNHLQLYKRVYKER